MIKKMLKISSILVGICTSFITLSMIAYYFNLDMKLTSMLEEPLDWWYDNKVKRNRGL